MYEYNYNFNNHIEALKKVKYSSNNYSNCVLFQVNLNDVLNTRYSDSSLPRNCFHQAPHRGLHLWSDSHIHISTYMNENDQIIEKSKDKKHQKNRNYIHK